uniref:NADH-ubiquinone oxidoreductase chain 2 n=1 Tax=Xibalbanus tulumensis TaxID=1519145 RepID=Q6SKZ2_XIBTU|nr:NADH dehydrogenase subunit 2 [Xibalbanus tulumensis]AAS00881.1 NADH dehydrogenase subunit 2 [Xibalbanus tulumensis]
MMPNIQKTTLIASLMMGTMISISSLSWFNAWIGLEMNMIMFMPLIMEKNTKTSEASMKYFLTQTMASLILLMSSTMPTVMPNMTTSESMTLITLALLIKIGASPTHFWLPTVMEGLSWKSCMLITTWQKIAPLLLLSYMLPTTKAMFIPIIILSVMTGTMGGLNQNLLRKLMAFSSINHMGWILSGMLMGNSWLIYFTMYCMLSLTVMFTFMTSGSFHMNQLYFTKTPPEMKLMCTLSLLSLGGLPPTAGFIPKLMIISLLCESNMTTLALTISLPSLISLYFYMRTSTSGILLSTNSVKWKTTLKKYPMLTVMSIASLPASTTALLMM